MPWDIPDDGGSKGPEEPEEGMKTERLWSITNHETGEKFLTKEEKDKDPDSGKTRRSFWKIGQTDSN